MPMQEKFTAVYTDYFQTGSHRSGITKFVRFAANDDKDIPKALEARNIEMNQVWFIFKGRAPGPQCLECP